MALCPVHNDTNSSLGIYSDHAYCFGCGKYWSVREFLQSCPPSEIRVSYQSRSGSTSTDVLYLPKSLPDTFNRWLNGEYKHKKEWLHARGIDDTAIRKYRLGYSPGSYTIPIFTVRGNVATVRFRRDDEWYDEAEREFVPKYRGIAGTNEVRLFNENILLLPQRSVYLCEGELDAIRLLREGLPAVSFTNGVRSVREDSLRYFDCVQRVYVCYDQDKAGHKGWDRLRKLLGARSSSYCSYTRVTWLPVEGKDVSEYITNKGIESFMELIDRS